MLAHFAEAVRPGACKLSGERILELQALIDRRTQLLGMRTVELNRLRPASKKLAKCIETHVRRLDKQIDHLDGS